jgi:UDP-glucose 4-epimerase
MNPCEKLNLAQQRCLVLGGSGFIGTNLCLALRSQTKYLRSFSKSPSSITGIDSMQGDFLNAKDIRKAVADIDVVFHLISTTTPSSSNANPLLDAQQNTLQTLELMDQCRAAGVKRVVFVSSGGTVYGDAHTPTAETHPQQPICAYGISKLAAEKYIHLYEHLHGITGIVLRVSNPYGPYQHTRKQQGVIGTFIAKSLAGESIEIWGDGSVVRDYIYIDDVIEALIKAATYAGTSRVFNIGSGIGTSLKDIVNTLASFENHEITATYMPSRSLDVSRSVLDCSLAEKELSWKPHHELNEGISKTLDWFRACQTKVGIKK